MLHWARYTIGYSFDVALSREVVMACNSCETNFQGSQTLVVSVAKSGSRAVLSVGNQGRNIVLIRRILLCVSFPGGGGTATLYLRAPPEGISWIPFHLPGTRSHCDVLHLERSSRRFHRAGASRIYRDRRAIAQLPNNNLR
jgi:hypothetical protein